MKLADYTQIKQTGIVINKHIQLSLRDILTTGRTKRYLQMNYQVEQHQITRNNKWYSYCEQTCFASKNLHNTAQFSNRQSWAYGHGLLSQPDMDKLFQTDANYKALPAKVSQLVLKQVADSWKSYFLALEAYNKDSERFTGKPKPPGYIEPGVSGRNLVKFNKQAISKSEFIKGWIVPSKSPIKIPVKPGLDFDNLVEVRIVPKTGCYVVEIVTEDNQVTTELGYEGLAASIDIGIDNLATIAFSDPTVQPLAINGKPLKSVNQ